MQLFNSSVQTFRGGGPLNRVAWQRDLGFQ